MPRLRAITGKHYPKPEFLTAVMEIGGWSKLTPEQRAEWYKEVEPGEWCDDMPEVSIARALRDGDVELGAAPRIEIDSGKGEGTSEEMNDE